MRYTSEELRISLFSGAYKVYDIFKDFFGEDYVDFRIENASGNNSSFEDEYLIPDGVKLDTDLTEEEYTEAAQYADNWRAVIYVWWPKVTVTNEFNKSVNITDLYAKIILTRNGCIPLVAHGFLLNRTSYTNVQFQSGYLHSHIPQLNYRRLKEFSNPCYGKGPIKETINSLKVSNDEVTWMLFCEELSRYVTVESVSGVPYFKLENIGNKREDNSYRDFAVDGNSNTLPSPFDIKMKDFVTWYLLHENHLQFSYTNQTFTISNSFYEFIIDISNSFIKWFNIYGNVSDLQQLKEQGILRYFIVADGKFYTYDDSENHFSLEGTPLFVFKGKMQYLKILPDTNDQVNVSRILQKETALHILYNILHIINTNYNGHTDITENTTDSEQAAANADKTVCYI